MKVFINLNCEFNINQHFKISILEKYIKKKNTVPNCCHR